MKLRDKAVITFCAKADCFFWSYGSRRRRWDMSGWGWGGVE